MLVLTFNKSLPGRKRNCKCSASFCCKVELFGSKSVFRWLVFIVLRAITSLWRNVSSQFRKSVIQKCYMLCVKLLYVSDYQSDVVGSSVSGLSTREQC